MPGIIHCYALTVKEYIIFACFCGFDTPCMVYMWHIFSRFFQISHGAIDHKFSSSIPQEVLSFDKAVDGLSITNSYGLFRRFVRNICIVWWLLLLSIIRTCYV